VTSRARAALARTELRLPAFAGLAVAVFTVAFALGRVISG